MTVSSVRLIWGLIIQNGIMMSREILSLFHEIRSELDLDRGVEPDLTRVYETADDEIIVVVSDRAEKSLFLGPGGRVITEIVMRLGRNISVFSEEEILSRENRLRLTEQRLYEMQGIVKDELSDILSHLMEVFRNEKELMYGKVSYRGEDKSQQIPVAFSGGVDSGATVLILRNWGFDVHAITVDLGLNFYTPDEIEVISEWTKSIRIKHTIVSGTVAVSEIVDRASEGIIHPCGDCHQETMQTVKNYLREREYKILVTGEMLPTGRQSIALDDGLLIVHLPAALALSKFNTRTICSSNGLTPEKYFGCRLVSDVHSQGWSGVRPSIHRVLRELEAGVLSTGQALGLIKDVLRPALKSVE